MISGFGPTQTAFVQPAQSTGRTLAKEEAGGTTAAPGPQGDGHNRRQGGVQALLNSAEAPRRVQDTSSSGKAPEQSDLEPEEERKVRELKRREAEVRAHEAAHSAAGGATTGATSFDYTSGPDGKRYVTGGEVQIDVSPVRDDPEATIRKMEAVIRAAHAPAEPSSQDLQVARKAQQLRAKAVNEAREQSGPEGAEPTDETGLHNRLQHAIEAYQEQREERPQADLSV